LFDSLGEEDQQPIERNIKIERNLTLDKLVKKFEKQLERDIGNGYGNRSAHQRHYDYALKNLSRGFGEGISAQDVEQFSVLLSRYNDLISNWKTFASFQAGVYLSAMVKTSEDDNFIIHTKQLQSPIYLIGFENTKNITVNGDVGYCGCSMQGGRILVKGNAKSVGDFNLGSFKEGEVEIKGNVGSKEDIRYNTSTIENDNGLVIVHGNLCGGIRNFLIGSKAVNHVYGNVYGSIHMINGVLHIEGDYDEIALRRAYGSYPRHYSCQIFHKGKPIVKDFEVNVPRGKIKWGD
jgi:hypothetical protein